MPTKVFDDTNVTGITQGYTSGPSGAVVPLLADFSFSRWGISGLGSDTGVTVSSGWGYQKTGIVGFDDPIVGLPVNAIITRVTFRVPQTASLNLSAAGGMGGGVSYHTSGLSGNVFGFTWDFGSFIFTGGGSDPSINKTENFNVSGSGADFSIDFSSPLTRSAFITTYGVQTLSMGFSGFANKFGLNTVSYGLSFDAGWSITVTYTTDSYSWFIPFETIVVNGRPIRVPTGAPIAAPTDNPPDGYYDAGPVADNPDGPPTYYWDSPFWWFFFPISTIPPDGISDWVPTVSPPECINCLTLPLGPITVLVADASGAYRLEQNKTNDTMYVRTDPDAVTTEDAMIPPPTAKIGYVP